MTNHIHLIVGSIGDKIENIVRGFKSYTSSEIRKIIENDAQESRKKWMLEMMYKAGRLKKTLVTSNFGSIIIILYN